MKYITMEDHDARLNEIASPKTPGGISKVHLTPIRRLGLSRKWKRSGGSPFVSPLASNTQKLTDEVHEKPRKRRLCVDDENIHNSPLNSKEKYEPSGDSTPTTVEVSISRKNSKIISLSDNELNTCTSEKKTDVVTLLEKSEDCLNKSIQINEKNKVLNKESTDNSPINNSYQIVKKGCTNDVSINENDKGNETYVREMHIPNTLTKNCITVIQNKIFGPEKVAKEIDKPQITSDSDDVPLSHIYNNENTTLTNSLKVRPVKKTESESSRKSIKTPKKKVQTEKHPVDEKQGVCIATQTSYSSDYEDNDFEVGKRTILIHKSYNKVVKPVKAKSIDSLTQKDIDELKAKIEMKKRLLLTKAMNKDTEELVALIKKWKKGCQDALMELVELLKKKLPDRTDMDYSNILQMLNIPHALVGYDEENECFNTPDDNSIIGAMFNELL